ncbi:MAG: hypothetical protein HOO92_02000 [Methylococcaceae bacterium]|nr:hypothetical protein [Methylococcaceae bacterium]
MKLLNITYTFALALILTACASVQTGMVDQLLQPSAPGMIVVSQPIGKGYYALVERTNGHWALASPLQDSPITHRQNDEQEILFVNRRLNSVAPNFDLRVNSREAADCTPYIQIGHLYTLCNSYFSTIDPGTTFGKNIVSCLLTLCLGAGTRNILDHNKVQQVVIEIGLIDLAKSQIAKENLVNYRKEFSYALKARDVDLLESLIAKYANSDPDGLIPIAKDRIANINSYESMYSRLIEIIDNTKSPK